MIFDVLTLRYGRPRYGKLEIEIGNYLHGSRAGRKRSDGIPGDTRELCIISTVVQVGASGLRSA